MVDLVQLLWRAEKTRRPDAITLPARPEIKSAKVTPAALDPLHADHVREYEELAAITGVTPPDLSIKAFELWLVEQDIPVFSLSAVVTYMDDKAAKESKDKCGWEWNALRPQDQRIGMSFGTPASRTWGRENKEVFTVPASDHYAGGTVTSYAELDRRRGGGFAVMGSMSSQLMTQEQAVAIQKENNRPWVQGQSRAYDKTIPLHALRKVAAIDKKFAGSVALMVCDYALAPAIQHPDPFLMAVVDNPNVANGTGRFVIDFWDEPGFGLEQQLK